MASFWTDREEGLTNAKLLPSLSLSRTHTYPLSDIPTHASTNTPIHSYLLSLVMYMFHTSFEGNLKGSSIYQDTSPMVRRARESPNVKDVGMDDLVESLDSAEKY